MIRLIKIARWDYSLINHATKRSERVAIYLTKESRVIIQGITGRVGSAQAGFALEYGTNLVGGVSPGKGGQFVRGVPVFNSALEAVNETGANASVVFIPASGAAEAVVEALEAGVKLIVVITEHIPARDSLMTRAKAREKGAVIIGPNCPGVLSVGIGKMGIMPTGVVSPGRIGVISRSGTLSYEVTAGLTAAGFGQSTIVGVGGDPYPCASIMEVLAAFERDKDTDATVLIGEVGGDGEERAAAYIKTRIKKPVFAYIAGRMAPEGKKMGHAGAIIHGNAGTAASKITALKNNGVMVASTPVELPDLIRSAMV